MDSGLDLYWCYKGDSRKRIYKFREEGSKYRIITHDENEKGLIYLDENETYYLGMDMSTSQSGLAIVDRNWNLVAMIDIISRCDNKRDFFSHLEQFMQKNFCNSGIRLAVPEEEIAQLERKSNTKILTE